MKFLILFIFATLLVLSGCTGDSSLEPSPELLVVRGYLYANEPVNDIQLTKTLSLGSEETSAPPVNDAAVVLVKDGESFSLAPSTGDSGFYHYEGEELTVTPGDEFEIQVTRGETVTTGKTTVPFPPENVTLSATTLTIPQEFRPGMDFSENSITLSWEEDVSSLFYVVIECTESDPEEIGDFGGRPPGDGPQRRLLFPPTNHNEQVIGRFTLSYLGQHVAKVYRVNQEYADLYQSRNQDSRDLNEPLTNIENGLGIFSAFASESVYFTVAEE